MQDDSDLIKHREPGSHLRPFKDVQKFLLSSIGRFTGEYSADNFLVTHSWPSFHNRSANVKMSVGGRDRTAFAVAFRTSMEDHDGIVIPNYEHVADMLCSVLSLLYGTKFNNHGPIESSGYYHFPDLRAVDELVDPAFSHNCGTTRPDFRIPLSINEIARILPLIFGKSADESNVRTVRVAIKFYHQALKTADIDVELAYLNLITSGEILSGLVEIDELSLLDESTRNILVEIENKLTDGKKAARLIRSKLRSIRRRFVIAISTLIDDAFFAEAEAEHPYARLKQVNLSQVLGAAYDLRSRYVHTGATFGMWVTPRGASKEEIQHGKPVVEDKEFGRILALAPTFIGLERIMRYALLRYASRFGVDLSTATETV